MKSECLYHLIFLFVFALSGCNDEGDDLGSDQTADTSTAADTSAGDNDPVGDDAVGGDTAVDEGPSSDAGDSSDQSSGASRVLQCDTQNAYVGYPLGIHCYGEDDEGNFLVAYELVDSSMPDAFLEGNAILTNSDLSVSDIGLYHFEVVGRNADDDSSLPFEVDARVEQYDIRLNVLHGSGSTQLNFPNALYDLLGAECGFDAYVPLTTANLPSNETVTVEVLSETEQAAVTCMVEVILGLPSDRPEVWLYARHYGTGPMTEDMFDVTGFRFWLRDHS